AGARHPGRISTGGPSGARRVDIRRCRDGVESRSDHLSAAPTQLQRSAATLPISELRRGTSPQSLQHRRVAMGLRDSTLDSRVRILALVDRTELLTAL